MFIILVKNLDLKWVWCMGIFHIKEKKSPCNSFVILQLLLGNYVFIYLLRSTGKLYLATVYKLWHNYRKIYSFYTSNKLAFKSHNPM